MEVDARLNDIDDCLYRVALKVLIIKANRVLLVQEIPEMWWGFPGGGVDHGETVAASLTRELEEELGVPAKDVISDMHIAHYTIGTIVNGVPRMNLFFRASVPEHALKPTTHIAQFAWFTKDEFLQLNMSPSYDKTVLADIIFGA